MTLNSKGSAKTKLNYSSAGFSGTSSAAASLRWSLFPKGNKGITPIIAVILLLMMTVAIAGAAFFWISRMQNQMQGGVESYQSTIFTQIASRVDVIDADCSAGGTYCANLTIFFQNTGNTKIDVDNSTDFPTTTWILKNENQAARCSSNWTSAPTNCIDGCGSAVQMDVGEIHRVVLSLSGACDINSTDVGKVFSFTADFSGKTTASGSFIAA
jgi:flagellin-like protein